MDPIGAPTRADDPDLDPDLDGLINADEYLNCPATKSDIAMLLKEIRELREKM